MDYTKRGVIQSGVATPTTAGKICNVGATAAFGVFGIEATVDVAGTEALHQLGVFTSAGVCLARLAIGTKTAGTSVRGIIGDGNESGIDASDCLIAADDYVYVASLVNDASASYSWRLIGNTSL